MVITQNDFESTIQEINLEKSKLENYNDELAKNVASTKALKLVRSKLEQENALLKRQLDLQNRRLNHSFSSHSSSSSSSSESSENEEKISIKKESRLFKRPTQKKLDQLYEIEISKLKDYLEICRNKRSTIYKELEFVKEDNETALNKLHQVNDHVNQLKTTLEHEKNQAIDYNIKCKALKYELENMENQSNLDKKVHVMKLKHLENHIKKLEADMELSQKTMNESMEFAAKVDKNAGNTEDIKSVLTIFKNEYERILQRAYDLEKSDLTHQIDQYEKKLSSFDTIYETQIERLQSLEADLVKLEEKRIKTNRRINELTIISNAESEKFENVRDSLTDNISKLTKKTKLFDKEIEVLIKEDNSTVKAIIQLQLEINAYRTLMEAEGFSFDNGSLKSLKSSGRRTSRSSSGSSSSVSSKSSYHSSKRNLQEAMEPNNLIEFRNDQNLDVPTQEIQENLI